MESMAGLPGDVQEIDSPHTGGEQRLMGITPGGVHEKAALVVTDSLGEGLGALLQDDLAPALGAGLGDVDLVAGLVEQLGNDDVALELGLANLALDAASVDSEVTQVRQQLLGTVLAADEIVERLLVIDEGCPNLAFDECGVRQEVAKERNVRLDTADAELDEGAENLAPGDLVCGTYPTMLVLSQCACSWEHPIPWQVILVRRPVFISQRPKKSESQSFFSYCHNELLFSKS